MISRSKSKISAERGSKSKANLPILCGSLLSLLSSAVFPNVTKAGQDEPNSPSMTSMVEPDVRITSRTYSQKDLEQLSVPPRLFFRVEDNPKLEIKPNNRLNETTIGPYQPSISPLPNQNDPFKNIQFEKILFSGLGIYALMYLVKRGLPRSEVDNNHSVISAERLCQMLPQFQGGSIQKISDLAKDEDDSCRLWTVEIAPCQTEVRIDYEGGALEFDPTKCKASLLDDNTIDLIPEDSPCIYRLEMPSSEGPTENAVPNNSSLLSI